MFKCFSISIFLMLAFFGYVFWDVLTVSTEINGQLNKEKNIEGVYELISEEINLKKPKEERLLFAPPHWTGQWQLNKGYFSSVLMKEDRGSLINFEDLGYESFAGTYEIEGDKILFRQNFSLTPFYTKRPFLMKFKFEKNTLILTKEIKPSLEDMQEGTMTIILKKVNP